MPDTCANGGARQSLADHVAARGAEIRGKYGPRIGWAELQRILADRECVRYPCELVFDGAALLDGELAHPVPRGGRPEDGFSLSVHPFLALTPDLVPIAALYQLVLVNYGEFASPEDAESFGAAILGLTRDDYYARLCAMADEIAPVAEEALAPEAPCGCGSHGSARTGCHG